MPRGDKRGPNGMGSLTGRGLGYCAGFDGPGFRSDSPPRGGAGFGYGRGRGFGRGRGYRNYSAQGFDVAQAYDPGAYRSDLVDELASLKEQLKVLEERIAGSQD